MPNGPDPTDKARHEQHPKQTCALPYRLDDVTETNDDVLECLHPSRAGKPGL